MDKINISNNYIINNNIKNNKNSNQKLIYKKINSSKNKKISNINISDINNSSDINNESSLKLKNEYIYNDNEDSEDNFFNKGKLYSSNNFFIKKILAQK